MGKCFERKEMHCHSCGLCQHLCQCISFWVSSIPVDRAHIPQSPPSKGKGQALILSVQGSLDRSEFFFQTGAKVRNSPRVIVRQKNLQAVFSSVLFRLFGHRTFAPVEESFAEASAALPQIAPVSLSFSGLRKPEFSTLFLWLIYLILNSQACFCMHNPVP